MIHALKSTGDKVFVKGAFTIGMEWVKPLDKYSAKQLTISFTPIKSEILSDMSIGIVEFVHLYNVGIFDKNIFQLYYCNY